MSTRKFQILFILLALVPSLPVLAADQETVFSAKVIRFEPWMPIKLTCGIAIVTRLAENEVQTFYRGALDSRRVIVQHLACNGDELESLKEGDEVLVVVTRLRKPEQQSWRKFPVGEEKEPALAVRFDAVEVAKRVYPTQTARSKQ